jgi:ankyrin repeat protein
MSDLDVWRDDIPEWKDDKEFKDIMNKRTKKEPHLQGLYTGETILHIAVINGDGEFVHFLLDQGANLKAEAVGEFFMPLFRRRCIQKRCNRTSWWKHLRQDTHVDDKMGYDNTESHFEDPDMYFGQLPLSFAACAGHESVLDVLKEAYCEKCPSFEPWSAGNTASSQLASTDSMKDYASVDTIKSDPKWKGFINFINEKDQLGNTACHIAVMHRQVDAVKWLLKHGASLRIMNKQGLTPFTLSVWMGYLDMYELIAKSRLGKTEWKYGPSCQFIYTDLEQIDSFRIQDHVKAENNSTEQNQGSYDDCTLHDQLGWRSAFEIIIENEIQIFAKEAIFNFLIKSKWKVFAWWMYIFCIGLTYGFVLIFYVAATVFRVQDLDRACPEPGSEQAATQLQHPIDESQCTSPEVLKRFDDISGGFIAMLGSFGAILLGLIAYIFLRFQWRDLDQNHDGRVSQKEFRMFWFKNLVPLCCVLSFCIIEAVIAARAAGKHAEVSACAESLGRFTVYVHIYVHMKFVYVFVFFVLYTMNIYICIMYVPCLMCIWMHISMYVFLYACMHALMYSSCPAIQF